jgi:hypothetical protein
MPGLLRCDRGDYARVLCLLSHARLRVHWAPGIPCALCFPGRTIFAKLGRIAPRECGVVSGFDVIARSDLSAVAQRAKAEATKQSRLAPVPCDGISPPFAPVGASGDTLHLRLRGGPPPEAESVGWWGRKDSNLRSHKTADLQSAPFATRDTSPLNSIATHPLKGGNKAMDDAET